MNRSHAEPSPSEGQAGGGMLGVVAAIGVILALAQGTIFYRTKGSAAFLGSEKDKILAMQMAEAGVEENIADLGRRKVKAASGMVDYPTYDHKVLEGGAYSSQLTVLGLGALGDTVDLVSTGSVGRVSQTIRARLRLKNHLDSTLTTHAYTDPDTVMTVAMVTEPRIDTTPVPPMSPSSMPALTTTAAYTACMASAAPKCNVCHLPPPGLLAGRYVTNIGKFTIAPGHGGHTGDYLTTDGTCDLYDTTYTFATTMVTRPDTTYAVVDKAMTDTVMAVDTLVRVQVLSWK